MDTGNPFGGGAPEINKPGQEQIPAPGVFTGFENLPQPQTIEAPLQVAGETEQSISNQEVQSVASQQPITQAQSQSTIATQPQAQTDATGKLPTVAGHANRIEKGWLEKGEKIFAATKDDPHSQKVQVDNLKDEYLAARYGEGGDAA
jgi:hypothetical protein